MTKYRIKVVTKGNGKIYYYPQWKLFSILWLYFEDFCGWPYYLHTIEDAKNVIDNDIKKEKNKKTISKEYIKYP